MKIVFLADVAQIIMGQSPPSSTYNNIGDGLPFFQGKTDFGDLYPTARVYCCSPKKISEAGDILISVRAPVGPTNVCREKSCIGRGLAAVRCNNNLQNWYLLYFLRYYENHHVMSSDGSTFDAIGREDLENIRIPLLSLSDQQRITAILEKADRLRRLCRYALETGEMLLQSVFLEMFGDPATNPKDWNTGSLGDVITSAKDGPHVSPEYTTTGIPFISTRNVRRGEMVWEDLKYISRADAERHWQNRECKPERWDILYTKGGTTGLAKAVDFDIEVAVWVHIAVLKLYRDMVDPLWLEAMLNTDYCYDQSQNLTFGIANHDLGLKRMPRIKMYIPPMQLQQEFSAIVLAYKKMRRQHVEALRQAEHLFQTLLHRAFNDHL